jgi:MFS family permease
MTLSGLRRVSSVFRYPDYAKYTAGNSLSLIGLWIQRIGVGWLAWDLTHSPTWLGIIAMTEFFPVVFMGPIGGVLADRFNRASNMIVFQSIAMLASGMMFALMLVGHMNIWLLAMLTLCVGIASGLNSASRLALAPSLVPKEHLTTAIAMNSMVFNTARFIGPAIAGIVIKLWGVEFAFAFNTFSYLTLIWALWAIRSKLLGPKKIKQGPGNVLAEIKEGVAIVLTNPGSKTVMVMMLATALLLRPIVQLLPGIVDEIYQSGVNGFAYLTASIGGGAIIGGYWMAQRESQENLHLGLIGILISAVGNSGVLFMPSINTALPFGVLLGGGMVMTGIGIQSTLQLAIAEKYRGRVLSLYGACFMGGPALGALGMGAIAEFLGLKLPVLGATLSILVLWAHLWPKRAEIIRHLKQLHSVPL